jgi:hypothetical protein
MEDSTVERDIALFFQELLAQQEPLGEEFARVLDDNFWSLIIRSSDSQ